MTPTMPSQDHCVDASLLSALLDVIRLKNSPFGDEQAHSSEALRVLREKNPEVRMRLVRHVEPFDESSQSALLITDTEGNVTTVSWSPPSTVPWPLRGARRAGESTLLSVDGETLTVGETILHLDGMWDRPDLLTGLIDACVIRIELEEAPVELTDAQMQDALDAFRRARGLLTRHETEAWMAQNHLSPIMFERTVRHEAELASLRRRVVADRASAWLREHGETLDRARIARAVFPDRAEAREFAARVADVHTYEADDAIRYFAGELGLVVADGRGKAEFCDVGRGDLDGELANLIFAAEPGTVMAAEVSYGEWEVVQVLAVYRTRNDAAALHIVERRLFDEWLAERRRAARVEWFWGEAEKTDRVTAGMAS
ncbi:TIGR04500 family putative peptide maturation system protein [Rhodococcus sp. HNM0563]|uniref:TIGR04500 family putative peptide maturation system protein n=1 Tax=Rhodococcus sp. HNM0563 TaxID=2716339 RepID=UPI00146BB26B|nr:TIGR04500 family putative peptide maturation system protein [Rhodococcus sp. HNM0563]NLU63733.1 TIGR04500 family putative peptide maturation system protein [Rhodococcus sp. HNM0563]